VTSPTDPGQAGLDHFTLTTEGDQIMTAEIARLRAGVEKVREIRAEGRRTV